MKISPMHCITAMTIMLLFVFSGCAGIATQGDEKYVCPSVDECLKCSDYARANSLVDATPPVELTGNNRILYYMDKGTVLQVMGNYKESS